uniref:Uncharacterized protein n=1 Tax=Vitis vinifera TaxID=29760 RepID=A5ANA7_VITVI|nr:hypothetical protein VITISV_003943 [Vitis vinifera]
MGSFSRFNSSVLSTSYFRRNHVVHYWRNNFLECNIAVVQIPFWVSISNSRRLDLDQKNYSLATEDCRKNNGVVCLASNQEADRFDNEELYLLLERRSFQNAIFLECKIVSGVSLSLHCKIISSPKLNPEVSPEPSFLKHTGRMESYIAIDQEMLNDNLCPTTSSNGTKVVGDKDAATVFNFKQNSMELIEFKNDKSTYFIWKAVVTYSQDITHGLKQWEKPIRDD